MTYDEYNSNTGLMEDYANAYFSHSGRKKNFDVGVGSREELLEYLSKGIQMYEDYVSERHPEKYNDAMQRAEPDSLKKLNDSVSRYNALSPEKKFEHIVDCASKWRTITIGEL